MTQKEKEQQEIDSELDKTTTSNDNVSKSHGEILKQQICEGQEVYKKSSVSILLSSFTAGLEIGFSYLLLATLLFFLQGKVAEDTAFKLLSLVYPMGFIMVIVGQSILFTEQTSLLTLPVLNKKQSLGNLLKLWGFVIVGNLLGGWAMAAILVWIGPKLHIFDAETVSKIAAHVTDYSFWVILVSAILAGWLMGLLSWVLSSSKDTISRIFIIYMITAVLSFAGLHHSIVGNVEVFAGLLVPASLSFGDYAQFQVVALLGNAIGGAVFVALLKYRAFVTNIKY
ncbi:formate/nitrite transporter family protein [Marixanthomonas spongiae]|uniref:Formate transporter n=1 Tax=Marixanthomonas spongiae TaxID=2174845 RepID=A0A2U0HWI8_9FLAO|nr:formate/nitrite transporter family protein [Marixanthomonas spongiae]PVW13225.1 formate transporter [Marixanthomonas spongiae]